MFLDIVNEAGEISEKITSSIGDKKAKLYTRLQLILIKLQDINDEKIHYGQMLSEMIETKFRVVDRDFQNNINNKTDRIQSPVPSSSTSRNASIVQQVLSVLPLKNTSAPGSNMSSSTNNSASENNNGGNGGNGSGPDKGTKRSRRTRMETNVDVERVEVQVKTEPVSVKPTPPVLPVPGTSVKKPAVASGGSGKKQKKATRKTNLKQNAAAVQEQVATGAVPDDTIDPDEETYCLCGQISYGEMILCENDLCPIEWFHFSCVSLQSKPKGRWYCPNCRGDRPNVMNKNLRKKYQDSPNTDRKFV